MAILKKTGLRQNNPIFHLRDLGKEEQIKPKETEKGEKEDELKLGPDE